jgi:hypothetical protein
VRLGGGDNVVWRDGQTRIIEKNNMQKGKVERTESLKAVCACVDRGCFPGPQVEIYALGTSDFVETPTGKTVNGERGAVEEPRTRFCEVRIRVGRKCQG